MTLSPILSSSFRRKTLSPIMLYRMRSERCKKKIKEYITTNKRTRYVTKRVGVIGGRLLELPLSLVYEILSRLPAKSVFSCMCVCKTFLNFLREGDPYFSQIHLIKAPDDDRCLILQDTDNFNIFFINMVEFEKLSPPWNNNLSPPWKTLDKPIYLSNLNVRQAHLIGSCNGLVFLDYLLRNNEFHRMLCVCNPILGEFTVLPQPWPVTMLFSTFGHCSKSNKYKVLRLLSPSIWEIHTLGTNHWRKICNLPYPHHFNFIDSSSLNGNIPWITETTKVSEIICSFNWETEKYTYLSPPAYFFTIDTCKRMTFMQVGLLGGLFCISYLLDKAKFEAYVMKCYGVESSWTKEISIDMSLEHKLLTRSIIHNVYLRLDNSLLHIIKLLNNGDMLLRYFDDGLVYYSPRKQAAVKVTGQYREVTNRYRPQENFKPLEFVPSFISLKNIIGKAGSVEVVRREKLLSMWPHKL